MINAYGPTEAGVVATSYVCLNLPADAQTVPIGFPVGGSRVYLLDGDRQQVPDWTVGDLFVGGEGTAPGYLGREDLTARSPTVPAP
ncbi:AMP-binding protein [Streptomyces syringium]|uniref:AMP-binding protein n=1 Tax=Streptomyces syringium TaxID=76729 RepID=UPI0034536724